MSKVERIKLLLIFFILSAIVIFFGCRKVDFHVDEIWNLGLSNHVGSMLPDIEYGKTYTGMGPFEDFVEVKDGEGFNYRSVFHNQWEDVHPPLYYCIFHTVCSFFPNSFSIWYSIGLNLFWMALTIIVLYKLLLKITGSSSLSMGILIAYGTTAMFINMILFIRMYAQLTFIAITLAYLLKCYWDEELDKKFYLLFSVIVISGMLTQYYFLIYSFALCSLFVLHLFFEKKIKSILLWVATCAVDAGIYLVIWRHIFKHIFHGNRGEEAIGAVFTLKSFKSMVDMIVTMNTNLFWGMYQIFAIILLIVFCKRIKDKTITFNFEYSLVYTAIFYLLVVGKISPYSSFRYITPVAYIFVMAAIVVLDNILKKKWNTKRSEYFVVGLCLLLNFGYFASNGFYAEMDFYTKEKADLYSTLEGKDCIIYVDAIWESPNYFTAVQKCHSYVFIDEEHKDLLEKYNKAGYVWATEYEHSNEMLEGVTYKTLYSYGNESYYEIIAE